MNTDSKKMDISADSALEDLLGRASPRLAPPSDDERLVRAAVHAEWAAMTHKRKVRRHFLTYAAAATVLLAIVVTYNGLSGFDEPAVQVATIDKSFGSIYLLGEQSELHEMTDVAVVSAGQTIVTDDKSGMGLAWGYSGSLRIDQNTRIEFISPTSVFLRSGRVYVDSQPTEALSDIDAGLISSLDNHLDIRTEHGDVTHLGTQYMTAVDKEELIVSVRDGQVSIDGSLYPATVAEGQRLTIVGSARPSVTNFPGYGDAWRWVESTAPALKLEGRTVYEFLLWVGNETGMKVYFDSSEAELLAKESELVGTVDSAPTEALAFWMSAVDLEWSIDDGFIRVRKTDAISGR